MKKDLEIFEVVLSKLLFSNLTPNPIVKNCKYIKFYTKKNSG